MFKELERKKPHLAVRHVRLTCKGAVKYCKRQLVHLSKSSTLRFASSSHAVSVAQRLRDYLDRNINTLRQRRPRVASRVSRHRW